MRIPIDIGEIVFRIRADAADLTQGLQQAGGQVKSFTEQISRAGRQMRRMGLLMTAVGTGILFTVKRLIESSAQFSDVIATQWNEAMMEFLPLWEELQFEISEKAIPAIKDMLKTIGDLINRFLNLSDETKTSIIQFAVWGAAVVAVIGAFNVLVGTLATLITSLGAIAGWIATATIFMKGLTMAAIGFLGVALKFALIGAVLLGVVGILAFLRENWDRFIINLQILMLKLKVFLIESWEKIRAAAVNAIGGIGNFFIDMVNRLITAGGDLVKKLGLKKLQRFETISSEQLDLNIMASTQRDMARLTELFAQQQALPQFRGFQESTERQVAPIFNISIESLSTQERDLDAFINRMFDRMGEEYNRHYGVV